MAKGSQSHVERDIDFCWFTYVAINYLGFTWRESGFLYCGEWIEMFENYKKQYNFKVEKKLYIAYEMEEESDLDVL